MAPTLAPTNNQLVILPVTPNLYSQKEKVVGKIHAIKIPTPAEPSISILNESENNRINAKLARVPIVQIKSIVIGFKRMARGILIKRATVKAPQKTDVK